MATYGYLVYLLRANEPHRVRNLQRLSALGDADDDLLALLEDKLAQLGTKYVREEKSAEGYRIKSLKRRGRTLSVVINKGPQGSGGEAYNVETDESIETTTAQALLSGLRGMFVIPVDSYFGLMFVERIGVRHLREVMRSEAVVPAAHGTGVVIHVESFAEAKDWESLLKPQQTLRVTEILEVRESGHDSSTASEPTVVRIVAEGGLVAMASEKIKRTVLDRVLNREHRFDTMAALAPLKEREAMKDGFSVEDAVEVKRLTEQLAELRQTPQVEGQLKAVLRRAIPVVKQKQLKHKSYEVATGVSRPERTFSVERDSLPVFVYETQERLTDSGLRKTWLAHAESILKARHVTLPNGWDK